MDLFGFEFTEKLNSFSLIHFLIPILIMVYVWYIKNYKLFYFFAKPLIRKPNYPRGSNPPSWTNGWFKVCDSSELKCGEVRPFDYFGRHIAVFRGTDKKVYAISAFCSHLGASLAVGGKIKFDNCIQCPFHGWIFSGETGENVISVDKDAKTSHVYKYINYKDPKCNDKDEYMIHCKDEVSKLDTFELREKNGIIYIWLHSKKELQRKPLWEPLDIDDGLVLRGKSTLFANCHIQEIGENGADLRHFDFVHTETSYVPFMNYRWELKSKPARDPDLYDYFKHENKSVNKFKMDLIEKHINDNNKNYINVLGLDGYIKILGYEFHFLNATGFQVGPASVHMFLKTPIFRFNFGVFPQTMGKFQQKIDQNVYFSSWLPYWFCAFLVKAEAEQIGNDIDMWNYKIFPERSAFNKGAVDSCLIKWRDWFAQFYDGCAEFEKSIEEKNLDW